MTPSEYAPDTGLAYANRITEGDRLDPRLFTTEEWSALKAYVNKLIANELASLEKYDDEKQANRHRGALNVLRRIADLDKPKRAIQQQQ